MNAAATCPWCKAPRDAGPKCGSCGAIYAKAEMIRTQGRAAALAASEAPAIAMAASPATVEDAGTAGPVEDWHLEWKLCLAAIPAALLLGVLFNVFSLGHFLQRTFLAMPVHELGHAVAAWFCGYAAIPTLWKTITPESRGFVAPVLLFAGLAWLGYRGWLARNVPLLAAAGFLVLLQFVGTFALKEKTADMVIVFGGDGVGMILGTLLMATFFFGKETQLYKGWLRWGFVAIGAAAYVDMFGVWLAARSDFGKLPLGEIDGVGLTDATKLVDVHGWTEVLLIRRYVTLGVLCLAALALVYAWGVREARRNALRS